MNERNSILEAIEAVAKEWIDPDYSVRVEAEKQLYSSSMRATPEAVAFAVNQQMPQLSVSNLTEWFSWTDVTRDEEIGVIQNPTVPFGDLGSWLTVILAGFEYVGFYESEPDPLFKAFVEDVCNLDPSIRVTMQQISAGYEGLSGIIGLIQTPEDVHEVVGEGNLPSAVLIREPLYNIAVLDGKESSEEREDLAEDILMHEGMSEMSVRIVWAPEELNPDPYFEAFAFFRGVYPAHERTPGSLQMRKAFLAAENAPHAYGDGLEFLISRGDPDIQEPCHIRWVTYKEVTEIEGWLEENASHIRYLVTRSALQNRLMTNLAVLKPGRIHRLSLNEQPDIMRIVSFLSTI